MALPFFRVYISVINHIRVNLLTRYMNFHALSVSEFPDKGI